MGGERNRVHLLTRSGVEDWPDLSKHDVAARLVERIAGFFAGGTDPAKQKDAPGAPESRPVR